VKDRQQPTLEISAMPEVAPPFIGPQKRILDKVFHFGLVPGQRASVAAQGTKLANNIKTGFRTFHNAYTDQRRIYSQLSGIIITRPRIRRLKQALFFQFVLEIGIVNRGGDEASNSEPGFQHNHRE